MLSIRSRSTTCSRDIFSRAACLTNVPRSASRATICPSMRSMFRRTSSSDAHSIVGVSPCLVGYLEPSRRPGGAGRQAVYFPLKEPAKPPPVLLLQLRLHPVAPGNGAATYLAAAAAGHRVVEVVRGCPVVGQLLSRADLPHGNEHDLSGDSDVWVARVIGVQHRAVPVLGPGRGDEQVLGDLDVGRSEPGLELFPGLGGENMP